MARRGKRGRGKATMAPNCGMCNRSFDTRDELSIHTATHRDVYLSSVNCPVCHWQFDNTPALEKHQSQTGHYAHEAHASPAALSAKVITCDRCPNTFKNQGEYKAHRSFPNGPCADFRQQTHKPAEPAQVDMSQPRQTAYSVVSGTASDDTPADMSDSGEWCPDCKTVFESKAKLSNHALACAAQKREKLANAKASPVNGTSFKSTQPAAKTPIKPVVEPLQVTSLQATANSTHKDFMKTIPAPKPAVKPSQTLSIQAITNNTPKDFKQLAPMKMPANSGRSSGSVQSAADSTLPCSVNGCGKSFRSEAELKTHRTDAHSSGRKAQDSSQDHRYTLMQSVRRQLQAVGLLRQGPPRGRGERDYGSLPRAFAPPRMTNSRPSSNPMLIYLNANRTTIAASAPVRVSRAVPTEPKGVMIGTAETDQGKQIHSKTLRLLIQQDIFVCSDGVVKACGVDWNRLSVSTQKAYVEQFDAMCHLPRALQSEYLPPPKAFTEEYTAQYPVADFEASPDRDPTKPGLSVVAIGCSKVILADGCFEIVKIAAVDVTTCRILMSNLVCTNPKAIVANWNTAVTGLFSWDNMEKDREAGYKVFKGWQAVRSALWKFVDKETIIIGHNLRADLDALRMVHGRAIDVAKVVEKAANGPLSKQQLSLDSLCRDYPKVTLKSDPEYGRDPLMNAFAVRQLSCWMLKNGEKLSKDAKQKTLDYQKVAALLKA